MSFGNKGKAYYPGFLEVYSLLLSWQLCKIFLEIPKRLSQEDQLMDCAVQAVWTGTAKSDDSAGNSVNNLCSLNWKSETALPVSWCYLVFLIILIDLVRCRTNFQGLSEGACLIRRKLARILSMGLNFAVNTDFHFHFLFILDFLFFLTPWGAPYKLP